MKKGIAMERASFITTEDGVDLMVSFALAAGEDWEVRSLTLVRTPKYESVLLEHERGVAVMLEDASEDEDDMLEKVVIEGDVMKIITRLHRYDVNTAKVDEEEVEETKRILKKMNFDGRFELKIV
jgi:methyl coenzyme M reductase beta subunit